MKMEKMEIDSPKESNGGTGKIKENGIYLKPVLCDDSGEGLPYAPINWPNPGDVWTWKVGKRVAITGHHLDRYLYLPSRLCIKEKRRKYGFASKLSVERYIRDKFPNADVDEFFASFSWKIPAKKQSLTNGDVEEHAWLTVPPEERAEHSASDSEFITGGCKAGNKMCSSLLQAENPPLEHQNPPLVAMPCDICCCEPRFCRDCCCILCCKTIDSAYGGYSYIKCEALVDEGYVCGHIAHVDCALRCYMAGTVGGSIGLDAEYYCRRCDAKKDLVSHVTSLLLTCESIDSRDDIEKILNVGVCILRGSLKTSAKRLLSRIEVAIAKLQCGTCLENLWKVEHNFSQSATRTGNFRSSLLSLSCKKSWKLENGLSHRENAALEVDPLNFRTSSPQNVFISSNHQIESLKLECEIDQVLQELRKSQDSEYKIAEERLYAQKNYLQNLYEQFDEKSELASQTSTNDSDSSLNAVLNRSSQIKREVEKLKDMKEVAKGLGKTSKNILKEHFGLEI